MSPNIKTSFKIMTDWLHAAHPFLKEVLEHGSEYLLDPLKWAWEHNKVKSPSDPYQFIKIADFHHLIKIHRLNRLQMITHKQIPQEPIFKFYRNEDFVGDAVTTLKQWIEAINAYSPKPGKKPSEREVSCKLVHKLYPIFARMQISVINLS